MWLKAISMGPQDHTRPYELFVDSIGRRFCPSHQRGSFQSIVVTFLVNENLSARPISRRRCPRFHGMIVSCGEFVENGTFFFYVRNGSKSWVFVVFSPPLSFQQILSVVLLYFPVLRRFLQVHGVRFLWFLARTKAISVSSILVDGQLQNGSCQEPKETYIHPHEMLPFGKMLMCMFLFRFCA